MNHHHTVLELRTKKTKSRCGNSPLSRCGFSQPSGQFPRVEKPPYCPGRESLPLSISRDVGTALPENLQPAKKLAVVVFSQSSARSFYQRGRRDAVLPHPSSRRAFWKRDAPPLTCARGGKPRPLIPIDVTQLFGFVLVLPLFPPAFSRARASPSLTVASLRLKTTSGRPRWGIFVADGERKTRLWRTPGLT